MEKDVRDATRLLIADAGTAEADRLVNIFRDEGQTTRAHHITSAETLESAFLEKTKWDLLIIANLPDDLSVSLLMETIDHQNADIPVILLVDYKDSVEKLEYLQQGIKAVVSPESKEMLLLVANQEIENLYIRRNYRRMSVALNESERQRRMLLDDEVDAILYIKDNIVCYTNPAFCQLLGQDNADLLTGRAFTEMVMEDEREDVGAFLTSVEETGQALAVLQCSLLQDGDDVLPVRVIIKPTSYDGAFSLSLQIKSFNAPIDEETRITAQKAVGFTELADKQTLLDQLKISVQKAASGKGRATLVHVSIDSLQGFFDSKGKAYSQGLEDAVADRIVDVLGVTHSGARLGGGQFGLLLNVGGESGVQALADELLKKVSAEPVVIEGEQGQITLSMGAIILGDNAIDASTLMVRAKHACGQAEKKGGGQLAFYKARKVGALKSVEKHIAMMLSQSMKNDGLKLYYQPIVSLKGAEGNYYEVWFSMTDMRGREHDCAHFRTKLDNMSLWGHVDRWTLMTASEQLADKRKDGNDTRLILTIGGYEIKNSQFLPWMKATLAKAGIPENAVTLELSESNIVRYGSAAGTFFDQVKSMGCRTAISEFGCSVNPLELAESVNVDFIKTDPSFTKDLTGDNRGEAFKDIINKVVAAGKQVIVPQVKNTSALAPLWHIGVDYVQGDFLQGPAESMEFSFDSDF